MHGLGNRRDKRERQRFHFPIPPLPLCLSFDSKFSSFYKKKKDRILKIKLCNIYLYINASVRFGKREKEVRFVCF